MKRGLLIFSLILIFFNTASVFAEMEEDQANGQNIEVDYMIEKGILAGYPDGTFRPNDNMSKSEFYNVINNITGLVEKANVVFKDVESTDWYYQDALKGVAAGYLNPQLNLNAREDITRGEVARIISIVLGIEESQDKAEVIMSYNPISRIEVVKMLYNISGQIVNEKILVDEDVEGNILISASGSFLKDIVVGGDVYLTAAIGEGNIHFDGVEIKGQLYIKGGGDKGINIQNSKIEKITIAKQGRQVTVILDDSVVGKLETKNKLKLELVDKSKVKEMVLDGNVQVEIGKDSQVDMFLVKSEEININGEKASNGLQAKWEAKPEPSRDEDRRRPDRRPDPDPRPDPEPGQSIPILKISPRDVLVSDDFNQRFNLMILNDIIIGKIQDEDIVLGGVFDGLDAKLIINTHNRVEINLSGQIQKDGIGSIGLKADVLRRSRRNLIGKVNVGARTEPVEDGVVFIKDDLLGDGFGLGNLIVYDEFAIGYNDAYYYSVIYSVGDSSIAVETSRTRFGEPTQELIQYKSGINKIDIVLYDVDGLEIAVIEDVLVK